MELSSFLVWWLLGVPVVLAVVDAFMIGKGKTAGAGTADGYIARQGGQTYGATTPATVRPL